MSYLSFEFYFIQIPWLRLVSSFKTAAIPQKLAEEVAEYVHSKFYTDRIPKTLEVCLTKEEEKEFDVCMSTGQIN